MSPMSETTRVWRIVEEWRALVRFPPNQSKIAEHVGVARSAVSDWKTGKARPTPEHLEALARMLEPQLGPGVHLRLTLALMSDMGYPASESLERRVEEMHRRLTSEPPQEQADAMLRDVRYGLLSEALTEEIAVRYRRGETPVDLRDAFRDVRERLGFTDIDGVVVRLPPEARDDVSAARGDLTTGHEDTADEDPYLRALEKAEAAERARQEGGEHGELHRGAATDSGVGDLGTMEHRLDADARGDAG